jgi:uncharacterized protein
MNDLLKACTGFDWDEGNLLKSWEKHEVSPVECEQIFFDQPFVTGADIEHSKHERRYYALGSTDGGRRLFFVFTIRGELIRVISARDMNRRERRVFDQS